MPSSGRSTAKRRCSSSGGCASMDPHPMGLSSGSAASRCAPPWIATVVGMPRATSPSSGGACTALKPAPTGERRGQRSPQQRRSAAGRIRPAGPQERPPRQPARRARRLRRRFPPARGQLRAMRRRWLRWPVLGEEVLLLRHRCRRPRRPGQASQPRPARTTGASRRPKPGRHSTLKPTPTSAMCPSRTRRP